jgi:hypothetical protein
MTKKCFMRVNRGPCVHETTTFQSKPTEVSFTLTPLLFPTFFYPLCFTKHALTTYSLTHSHRKRTLSNTHM